MSITELTKQLNHNISENNVCTLCVQHKPLVKANALSEELKFNIILYLDMKTRS